MNNILGYQIGFSNITSQIQNLNSDVSQFKSEIISKIEVIKVKKGTKIKMEAF